MSARKSDTMLYESKRSEITELSAYRGFDSNAKLIMIFGIGFIFGILSIFSLVGREFDSPTSLRPNILNKVDNHPVYVTNSTRAHIQSTGLVNPKLNDKSKPVFKKTEKPISIAPDVKVKVDINISDNDKSSKNAPEKNTDTKRDDGKDKIVESKPTSNVMEVKKSRGIDPRRVKKETSQVSAISNTDV